MMSKQALQLLQAGAGRQAQHLPGDRVDAGGVRIDHDDTPAQACRALRQQGGWVHKSRRPYDHQQIAGIDGLQCGLSG